MKRYLNVINLSHPLLDPLNVVLCDTFFSKFKGLMFTKEVNVTGGILIDEKVESKLNTAIHMLFMNYDIAAIWLNKSYKVVDLTLAKKWHMVYSPSFKAKFVLEIHSSRLNQFHRGDQLTVENA